uniref:PDZ domain-containing protein n=1 Tax=Castor canadensis TaxID=51338 RepID=A0A8C0W4I0_CASCN
MESRAGDTADLRGSRGGRGLPLSAGPRSRQLLARLDARPLAARAATDLSALVRRAGTTLRLRKEAVSVLDSADIEVTDSRLPHGTLVEHRSQHRRSETLGTCNTPPPVTQGKASCASKPPQTSGRFSVELVRGPEGFGLTLSGGRGASGDASLAVRGLLKDGPAQRCGRLQAGDHVLHINGESTQGLTHAQVVERIRSGGPRLHLVLRRPLEPQPGKLEGVGGPLKGNCSPDPRGPEMRSSNTSLSPIHRSRSSRTPKTRGGQEPSPEAVVDRPELPTPEHHAEDLDDRIPSSPSSPGPWLVPSEERLSQALGVPGAAKIAQEMAAGRRRH